MLEPSTAVRHAYQGCCTSMSARSVAMFSTPYGTGRKRYMNGPAYCNRNTRWPLDVSSLALFVAPHPMTQSPPASLRALPQQPDDGAIEGSLCCPTSAAVRAVV